MCMFSFSTNCQFSIVIAPIYIPPAVSESSSFSTSSSTLFHFGHPGECLVVLHYSFTFPWWVITTCFFFFFFLCLFRAAPAAYGSSQARGRIEAAATATATATPNPSHICDLHHSSQQHWILNPLGKARNWTRVLMDTSWVCYHGAMMGTP